MSSIENGSTLTILDNVHPSGSTIVHAINEPPPALTSRLTGRIEVSLGLATAPLTATSTSKILRNDDPSHPQLAGSSREEALRNIMSRFESPEKLPTGGSPTRSTALSPGSVLVVPGLNLQARQTTISHSFTGSPDRVKTSTPSIPLVAPGGIVDQVASMTTSHSTTGLVSRSSSSAVLTSLQNTKLSGEIGTEVLPSLSEDYSTGDIEGDEKNMVALDEVSRLRQQAEAEKRRRAHLVDFLVEAPQSGLTFRPAVLPPLLLPTAIYNVESTATTSGGVTESKATTTKLEDNLEQREGKECVEGVTEDDKLEKLSPEMRRSATDLRVTRSIVYCLNPTISQQIEKSNKLKSSRDGTDSVNATKRLGIRGLHFSGDFEGGNLYQAESVLPRNVSIGAAEEYDLYPFSDAAYFEPHTRTTDESYESVSYLDSGELGAAGLSGKTGVDPDVEKWISERRKAGQLEESAGGLRICGEARSGVMGAQTFFFRVENMKKRSYRFHIHGLAPSAHWGKGRRPLMLTETGIEAALGSPNVATGQCWQEVGEDLSWQPTTRLPTNWSDVSHGDFQHLLGHWNDCSNRLASQKQLNDEDTDCDGAISEESRNFVKNGEARYYTLSFTVRVEDSRQAYFAASIPYSYTYQQSLAKALLNNPPTKAHLQILPLTRSLGGNRVDVWTITEQCAYHVHKDKDSLSKGNDPEMESDVEEVDELFTLESLVSAANTPEDVSTTSENKAKTSFNTNGVSIMADLESNIQAALDAERATIKALQIRKRRKPIIAILARERGSDTASSWMSEGLITFLLSDAAEAQELRRQFIFVVLPMINVDGTVNGLGCGDLLGCHGDECGLVGFEKDGILSEGLSKDGSLRRGSVPYTLQPVQHVSLALLMRMAQMSKVAGVICMEGCGEQRGAYLESRITSVTSDIIPSSNDTDLTEDTTKIEENRKEDHSLQRLNDPRHIFRAFAARLDNDANITHFRLLSPKTVASTQSLAVTWASAVGASWNLTLRASQWGVGRGVSTKSWHGIEHATIGAQFGLSIWDVLSDLDSQTIFNGTGVLANTDRVVRFRVGGSQLALALSTGLRAVDVSVMPDLHAAVRLAGRWVLVSTAPFSGSGGERLDDSAVSSVEWKIRRRRELVVVNCARPTKMRHEHNEAIWEEGVLGNRNMCCERALYALSKCVPRVSPAAWFLGGGSVCVVLSGKGRVGRDVSSWALMLSPGAVRSLRRSKFLSLRASSPLSFASQPPSQSLGTSGYNIATASFGEESRWESELCGGGQFQSIVSTEIVDLLAAQIRLKIAELEKLSARRLGEEEEVVNDPSLEKELSTGEESEDSVAEDVTDADMTNKLISADFSIISLEGDSTDHPCDIEITNSPTKGFQRKKKQSSVKPEELISTPLWGPNAPINTSSSSTNNDGCIENNDSASEKSIRRKSSVHAGSISRRQSVRRDSQIHNTSRRGSAVDKSPRKGSTVSRKSSIISKELSSVAVIETQEEVEEEDESEVSVQLIDKTIKIPVASPNSQPPTDDLSSKTTSGRIRRSILVGKPSTATTTITSAVTSSDKSAIKSTVSTKQTKEIVTKSTDKVSKNSKKSAITAIRRRTTISQDQNGRATSPVAMQTYPTQDWLIQDETALLSDCNKKQEEDQLTTQVPQENPSPEDDHTKIDKVIHRKDAAIGDAVSAAASIASRAARHVIDLTILSDDVSIDDGEDASLEESFFEEIQLEEASLALSEANDPISTTQSRAIPSISNSSLEKLALPRHVVAKRMRSALPAARIVDRPFLSPRYTANGASEDATTNNSDTKQRDPVRIPAVHFAEDSLDSILPPQSSITPSIQSTDANTREPSLQCEEPVHKERPKLSVRFVLPTTDKVSSQISVDDSLSTVSGHPDFNPNEITAQRIAMDEEATVVSNTVLLGSGGILRTADPPSTQPLTVGSVLAQASQASIESSMTFDPLQLDTSSHLSGLVISSPVTSNHRVVPFQNAAQVTLSSANPILSQPDPRSVQALEKDLQDSLATLTDEVNPSTETISALAAALAALAEQKARETSPEALRQTQELLRAAGVSELSATALRNKTRVEITRDPSVSGTAKPPPPLDAYEAAILAERKQLPRQIVHSNWHPGQAAAEKAQAAAEAKKSRWLDYLPPPRCNEHSEDYPQTKKQTSNTIPPHHEQRYHVKDRSAHLAAHAAHTPKNLLSPRLELSAPAADLRQWYSHMISALANSDSLTPDTIVDIISSISSLLSGTSSALPPGKWKPNPTKPFRLLETSPSLNRRKNVSSTESSLVESSPNTMRTTKGSVKPPAASMPSTTSPRVARAARRTVEAAPGGYNRDNLEKRFRALDARRVNHTVPVWVPPSLATVLGAGAVSIPRSEWLSESPRNVVAPQSSMESAIDESLSLKGEIDTAALTASEDTSAPIQFDDSLVWANLDASSGTSLYAAYGVALGGSMTLSDDVNDGSIVATKAGAYPGGSFGSTGEMKNNEIEEGADLDDLLVSDVLSEQLPTPYGSSPAATAHQPSMKLSGRTDNTSRISNFEFKEASIAALTLTARPPETTPLSSSTRSRGSRIVEVGPQSTQRTILPISSSAHQVESSSQLENTPDDTRSLRFVNPHSSRGTRTSSPRTAVPLVMTSLEFPIIFSDSMPSTRASTAVRPISATYDNMDPLIQTKS